MEKIKLSALAVTILLFTTYPGSSQNQMATDHQMTKSQTIKLKKGELFLVISSITKPDAQDLMNAYFGKIFPVASKNGFKPLASLPIDKIVAGNYKPNNFVGLYSWPNMSSVESFLKEMPNSELKPMRMKIWNELKQSVANVTEDFEFTLKEGKVYEVQTLWGDGSMGKKMNQSLIEKYNGKIIIDFPVVSYEDLNNGMPPSQIILIEWSSEKEAKKYRMKKKSSNKEESFYTHLQIPEMPAK